MSSFQSIPTGALSLEYSCDSESIREVCQHARTWLAQGGLSKKELDGWDLVLAEATKTTQDDGTAQMDLRLTAKLVEIRLTSVALPIPENQNGPGFSLIQSNTDYAHYQRSPGENCLVLRKATSSVVKLAELPSEASQALRQELADTNSTLDLMTEEVAASYESLAAIFRFSAALQAGATREDFTTHWLGELLKIAASDWYALRLVNAEKNELRVAHTSIAGWLPLPLRLDTPTADCGIELQAANQAMDIWFEAGSPLAAGEPLAQIAPAPNGLTHPIFVNDSLVGVLSVGRSDTAVFEAGQVNIIHTFADFLGIQLRNAQFQEEQVRARLVTHELEIAADIQNLLLPTRLPKTVGFEVASHYCPARQMGGDFYDVIQTQDGNLLLVVADVMGKGLPAAIFATIFRTLVSSHLELAPTPGKFINWLNRNLINELDKANMFITAYLVFVDFKSRQLRGAGAGHPPILMAVPEGTVSEIESVVPPLGVTAFDEDTEEVRTFPCGGRVLLYTDGLSEARSPAGAYLGIKGLKDWIEKSARAGENAEAGKASLLAHIRDFEKNAPPADDQAFILLTESHPHAC